MRYLPEIFRVSFWCQNETLCKISRSFDDGKLNFQSSGFWQFLVCKLQTGWVKSKFLRFCASISSLTFGENFMSADPVVPEISGGWKSTPQMLLSCQKQQMLLTVKSILALNVSQNDQLMPYYVFRHKLVQIKVRIFAMNWFWNIFATIIFSNLNLSFLGKKVKLG